MNSPPTATAAGLGASLFRRLRWKGGGHSEHHRRAVAEAETKSHAAQTARVCKKSWSVPWN